MAERIIRRTTALAVVGVATASSYEPPYVLVRMQRGRLNARLMPLTVVCGFDGDAELGASRGASSGTGSLAPRSWRYGDAGS